MHVTNKSGDEVTIYTADHATAALLAEEIGGRVLRGVQVTDRHELLEVPKIFITCPTLDRMWIGHLSRYKIIKDGWRGWSCTDSGGVVMGQSHDPHGPWLVVDVDGRVVSDSRPKDKVV